MKIVVEHRPIVGTLKTLVGTYLLLDDRHPVLRELRIFNVVDDEGFDNHISMSGDFVIIPNVVIEQKQVKRVVTEEEAAQYPELLKQLQEVE